MRLSNERGRSLGTRRQMGGTVSHSQETTSGLGRPRKLKTSSTSPNSFTKQDLRVFQVLMAGDQDTGKSSLCQRFTANSYNPSALPLRGIQLTSRTVELDGCRVVLQLFDVDAQRLRMSTSMSIRYVTNFYEPGRIHGAVVVYDANRMATFESVHYWVDAIKTIKPSQDVRIILVGNKCDMEERQVEYDVARQFADERAIPFMEVSAKDGTNVELAFMVLAAEVMNCFGK